MIPILAIVAMLSLGGFLLMAADDETDAVYTNVVGTTTFVEKGMSASFTISGNAPYPYEGYFVDGGGKRATSSSTSGTVTPATPVSKSITAPGTAGDYWFLVKFFSTEDKTKVVSELKVPMKVVDPIVLKATLKNTGSISVTLNVFFSVDGVRIAGSDSQVTIAAGESKEVTQKYVVQDFSGTHSFYVDSDDTGMLGTVEGLGPSHSVSFYSQDVNHDWMNYLMVIVVVILILVLIYVYRKPVKNYGKPKGRRR